MVVKPMSRPGTDVGALAACPAIPFLRSTARTPSTHVHITPPTADDGGSRHPFADLWYFNFLAMIVIDPMHTLGGVLQDLFELLLNRDKFISENVAEYERTVNSRDFGSTYKAGVFHGRNGHTTHAQQAQLPSYGPSHAPLLILFVAFCCNMLRGRCWGPTRLLRLHDAPGGAHPFQMGRHSAGAPGLRLQGRQDPPFLRHGWWVLMAGAERDCSCNSPPCRNFWPHPRTTHATVRLS